MQEPEQPAEPEARRASSALPGASLMETVNLLERKLSARTFELEVLHELSSKIGTSLTYEELFRAILLHLGKAIQYDVAASLLIAGPDCCHLYLRSVRPLADSARTEVEVRLLTACARLGKASVKRDDLQLFPVGESDVDEGAPALERLCSFFQVPILADGVAVGLIFVGAAATDQFTEEHIRLLYTVAIQASAAVERMQQVLETERRRLRAVVEHLPEGTVLLDGSQRVTMANPAGQRFLEALSGAGLGEILTRVGATPFTELEKNSPLDVVIPGPVKRVLEVTAVRLGLGAAESWLLVFRDVTEVREAVRRRDHFLAMLSHELRNPLAAITNAVQLLNLGKAGKQLHEQAKDILSRQVGHIKRLVDDLLDMSRFLHGKIHVYKHPVDLGELVARSVKAHQSSFAGEGKRLVVEQLSQPIGVYGDEARLTQIIDNLLSNARKFTSAGEVTYLSCTQEGNQAVLKVRDGGIGIALEKQLEIFEPFMQLDETIDRSQGGLGLGLALVKVLVTMHDGTITVRSDGHGTGSEFAIQFPSISLPRAAASRSPSGGASRARHILLVEDEQDIRHMLRELLKLLGHRVTEAASGPEAVAAFRASAPEMALIDIGLPGMDGLQVARALRDEARQAGICLIALSGYAQADDRQRALEAGFDHHLAKPIQLDELERILERGLHPATSSVPPKGKLP